MTRMTMQFSVTRKVLCATFLVVLLCGAGNTGKIKCWKNNEGVRECGNTLPPEFAQQGHDEVSAGGVRLESTGRAKSLEELEAEREEAKKKAAAELREREQAAKDRVLLDTFSSDDDMLLARDGQITHLESQVRLTESHIDKLNKGLEELIQDAADHERRGNQPPEKLIGDIDSLDRLKRHITECQNQGEQFAKPFGGNTNADACITYPLDVSAGLNRELGDTTLLLLDIIDDETRMTAVDAQTPLLRRFRIRF